MASPRATGNRPTPAMHPVLCLSDHAPLCSALAQTIQVSCGVGGLRATPPEFLRGQVTHDYSIIVLDWESDQSSATLERIAGRTGFGISRDIVILTTDFRPEMRTALLHLGASSVVLKPFGSAELVHVVRGLIQRSRLVSEADRLRRQADEEFPEPALRLIEAQEELVRWLSSKGGPRHEGPGADPAAARRIGELSASVAEAMGLPPRHARLLRLAAPLGLMDGTCVGGVSRAEGPGAPSPGNPFIRAMGQIAATRTERFDGGGFPNGLRGDVIPVFGRIVAAVAAYVALCGKGEDAAFDVLDAGAGTFYDPSVVEALGMVRAMVEVPCADVA